ncbi:hypothetical protein [Citrobacter freundii]|uniref:hypothetical protein n=1 Tax=Citrobacter freundii TaxID=546 RepID=UPI00388D91CA
MRKRLTLKTLLRVPNGVSGTDYRRSGLYRAWREKRQTCAGNRRDAAEAGEKDPSEELQILEAGLFSRIYAVLVSAVLKLEKSINCPRPLE